MIGGKSFYVRLNTKQLVDAVVVAVCDVVRDGGGIDGDGVDDVTAGCYDAGMKLVRCYWLLLRNFVTLNSYYAGFKFSCFKGPLVTGFSLNQLTRSCIFYQHYE